MKPFVNTLLGLFLVVSLWQTAFAKSERKEEIVKQYTKIAFSVYEDSLTTAKSLSDAVDVFIKSPSEKTLSAAKNAWKKARIPYSQSEVLRFGHNNVDLWEGKVNAWPLDEGIIDYVAPNYQHELGNVGSTANLIANKTEFAMNGKAVDTSIINFELLFQLHEFGGSEANVTTGYHAIEFLLWGQDLNGTGPGAGQRPYTDFIVGKKCTNGSCQRRVNYLQSVVQLLIIDLEDMVEQWDLDNITNYRSNLVKESPADVMARMFYGMANLSIGELAGERMKVASDANSTEDEQDCFSDNTHFSHFYNAKGIQNIYLGRYVRPDGRVVSGASLSSLVRGIDAGLDQKLQRQFIETENALSVMVEMAERAVKPMKFDQMVAANNKEGKAIVENVIASLVAQTELIGQAANVLGITDLHY